MSIKSLLFKETPGRMSCASSPTISYLKKKKFLALLHFSFFNIIFCINLIVPVRLLCVHNRLCRRTLCVYICTLQIKPAQHSQVLMDVTWSLPYLYLLLLLMDLFPLIFSLVIHSQFCGHPKVQRDQNI